MTRRARVALWVLGSAPWVLAPSWAHDPISTRVTWDREISAIIERRCLACHARGGFGTFPLATYEEARPWAVAIKELTLSGEMPPWGAAVGVGHFANDRRLTRHEVELIAAWVDGGAPRTRPDTQGSSLAVRDTTQQLEAASDGARPGGTVVPLAPATIASPTQRTASVTLSLPGGLVLTQWTFEPGTPAIAERVDFEVASRWLGTWTPGDAPIRFPEDAGVPLTTSALLTARIAYRAPAAQVVDHSRLRIWMGRDARPKAVRELTVVRSWRALNAVDVLALRPAREGDRVEVVARFTSGRVEPLAALAAPAHAPHPTYRLARPLALTAGATLETSAPVRLLYATGATRTVNPNVRRRPPR